MMKCILIVVIFCLATGCCNATSIRKRNQINKETFSTARSTENEANSKRLKDNPKKRKTKGKRSDFASISDLTERVDRNRKLKKGHDRYGGYYPAYRNDEETSYDDYDYAEDKGKKKKKGKYGKGKKNGKKSRSTCRKVVEPVEFFMDPPVEIVLVAGSQNFSIATQSGVNFTTPGRPDEMNRNGTTGNTLMNDETIDFDEIDFDEFNETIIDIANNLTFVGISNTLKNNMSGLAVSFGAGDAQELGTRFIFNGPLFALDDEGVVILDDFFISGVCTRTWMSLAGIPGASHCNLALSVDTGDSIIIEGEVFDGWDSNLSVEGGTLELMGSDGQITITPVDEFLVPLGIGSDVFLDSAFLRGRGTIIYNICEEEFWEQAEKNFENLDSEIAGSYPDPFDMMKNK